MMNQPNKRITDVHFLGEYKRKIGPSEGSVSLSELADDAFATNHEGLQFYMIQSGPVTYRLIPYSSTTDDFFRDLPEDSSTKIDHFTNGRIKSVDNRGRVYIRRFSQTVEVIVRGMSHYVEIIFPEPITDLFKENGQT